MKDYQKEREQMEDLKVMEYLKDKQVGFLKINHPHEGSSLDPLFNYRKIAGREFNTVHWLIKTLHHA